MPPENSDESDDRRNSLLLQFIQQGDVHDESQMFAHRETMIRDVYGMDIFTFYWIAPSGNLFFSYVPWYRNEAEMLHKNIHFVCSRHP